MTIPRRVQDEVAEYLGLDYEFLRMEQRRGPLFWRVNAIDRRSGRLTRGLGVPCGWLRHFYQTGRWRAYVDGSCRVTNARAVLIAASDSGTYEGLPWRQKCWVWCYDGKYPGMVRMGTAHGVEMVGVTYCTDSVPAGALITAEEQTLKLLGVEE